MWHLAGASGTLDRNSSYAYLMACLNFPETCVIVSENNGCVKGFVVGYVVPVRPDAFFVWQIAVDPESRGRGIGREMLDAVLARDACRDVRYLEATVVPSNPASVGLFEGFAARHDAACEQRACFSSDDFPDKHEPEVLLRIGPLSPNRRKV